MGMLKVVRLIVEDAILESRTSIAKEMLLDGETVKRVKKYTKLSREDVEKLQAELDAVHA